MTKNESKSSNLCSVLNCSIPPPLFGAAVLMGNQSSNKEVDCGSIQTLSLWFLSLKDTNPADTAWSCISRPYYGSYSSSLSRRVSISSVYMRLLYIWVWLRHIYMDSYHMAVLTHVSGAPFLLVRACRDACLSPTLLLFALQCPCRTTSIIMKMKHTRIHCLWTAQPQRASKVDMSPTHRWKSFW